MSKSQSYQVDPNIEIITGVCPHDCPDTCAWQVAVDHTTDNAIDIWGHPDHPVTQGRLCGKVDRYLERVYHSDRLTTPLKRTGPKGSGQFEPISWDRAMDEIAEQLTQVVDDFGPESVLPYSYAGTMGLLQGEGMAQRFLNRLGASHLAHTICSEAGFEGYLYTIGAAEGMETEAYAKARLILIWGSNTLTSNLHLWPFIQEARREGAKVIVIDPARTRTAQAADEWIAIRPGTDGALALAMMHVIIDEDLCDEDYVARYTVGFDALRDRVADWTPDRAAVVTGVPVDDIRQLARTYATTPPAAIRLNYGMQRHRGGGMATRTIACLPALIGAWRFHGGGIQLSTSGAFRHLELSGLYRPDLRRGQTARTINMNRLGDALSLDRTRLARAHYHPRPVDSMPNPEDAGPPVKALIVFNSNPAAVAPDQGAVQEGLRRKDLLTIVLEQFPTDTADYADYVLPATTQLEHWDLLKAYGHLNLSLNQPAIAPLGESLPNAEIFRRRAKAMGFTDSCFTQGDEEILREVVESQQHERFNTLTWEELQQDGYVRVNLPSPYLPFAEGNFPTPSGKCEFYSQRLSSDGYDPLPTYTPPRWADYLSYGKEVNSNGHSAQEGDLVCISPPAHSFLNSTFVNVERFQEREQGPLLHIHPHDAATRQVTEGSLVRVSNGLGTVQLIAHLSTDIIPGTVLAPGIWWSKFSPDRRNINQVTPQAEADMGAGASFYDVVVAVTPDLQIGQVDEHIDLQTSSS